MTIATSLGAVTGYKQSEVGVIPEDWEVRSLRELFTLKNGFAFSSAYFSDRGPIVLTPGNFRLDGSLYFNERNTKHYSGRYDPTMVFQRNDLLIVMTDLTPDCNLLGKPAFVHQDGVILHNQRIGKVVRTSDRIALPFLYWHFLSDAHAARMKETATGTTVRHTSNGSVYASLIARELKLDSSSGCQWFEARLIFSQQHRLSGTDIKNQTGFKKAVEGNAP